MSTTSDQLEPRTTGNTSRRAKLPFKGQAGRCAWCGTTEIPKGRKSWCSQVCVDEYLMLSSAEHVRKKVFRRDRGICAICGCDAVAAYREWSELNKEVCRLAWCLSYTARWNVDWSAGSVKFRDTSFPDPKELKKFTTYLQAKYVPGGWTSGRKTGWDADHIVPVSEGGGGCSLDGYRTLCQPCHKVVTAELAARRAAERRSGDRRMTLATQ